MKGTSIPDDVRRFIVTSVPSIPHLEGLLLLRDATVPAWNADILAQRLYIGTRQAADLIEALHSSGFLAPIEDSPGNYRYEPIHPSLREIADKLAQAYQTDLIGITNLVHSANSKKVQQFADAFKWRRD
ncbi:MAG TPA: hypothetical protein VN361_11030 [Oxalicibacterium sp.]|nr:hypothetical protein [Oxalicibacterium sp.]